MYIVKYEFQRPQVCDPCSLRSDLPGPDGAADRVPQQEVLRQRASGPHEQLQHGRGHSQDHQEVLGLQHLHQDIQPELLPPDQQGVHDACGQVSKN